MATLMAANSAL